jgi:hypothetical protein
MSLLSIKDHFYNLKKVHNILPTYFLDFEDNIYTASCIYNNVLLECRLKPSEIKHIDTDYLYFDIAILLTEKLNKRIDNCIKLTVT